VTADLTTDDEGAAMRPEERADSDIAAIQSRHVRVDNQDPSWCQGCGRDWPCDTKRVLDVIDRIRTMAEERVEHRPNRGDEICGACWSSDILTALDGTP
jgi:hypothetical protein